MTTMTEEFKEALAEVIEQALASRSRMDVEEHAQHHEWIAVQIERDRAKTEFYRGLISKSIAGVIWTALASAAGAVGIYIQGHWKP